MSALRKEDSVHIREVWNSNLEAEFLLIRDIVDNYPYIGMDTEFPGVVVRVVGEDIKETNDTRYRQLRTNVDMMKLIQLGLVFSDENGNLPTCVDNNKYCIWQFNFREFNVKTDIYANDSIELLCQSGIDFDKNNQEGIDANHFAELLMGSGIVLNGNVHWVTFHGSYDFGYLLKVLTCKNLPDTQIEFFNLLNIFFPVVYDVKHIMKFCCGLYGGLAKVGELLAVPRIVGTSHTAGSDSLLTLDIFWKLKKIYLLESWEQYLGVLHNLGAED